MNGLKNKIKILIKMTKSQYFMSLEQMKKILTLMMTNLVCSIMLTLTMGKSNIK